MIRPANALRLLPLAGLALLSACGKPDGELTAGQWKSTMQMTRFDVPGAPPAMQEQLKAMIGRSQSAESCMSAAEAKAGVRDFSKNAQQGDCKLEDYTQGGGKMSGKLVCKGTPFGDQGMKIEGTYTDKMVELTMSGNIEQPSIPGGKASMAMKVTSERIGDCAK